MSLHPAWPPGANQDPDLDRLYYVIVGMGVAALTNHLALRATNAGSLQATPILHVGDVDPWKEYAPVEMGQWPALLALPGSRHRPRSVDDHAFLPSQEFVRVSEAEWQDLAGAYEFFALRGHVTAIHETAFGYEVECVCGETIRRIRASRVDICGGPGPSRRLEGEMILDAALRQEYEDGIGRKFEWPRIVTGEMFLRKSTALAPPGARMAVLGGGPTAAWCVERAESNQCSVLWTAAEILNPAFLSSGRNDSLAQWPLVRSRVSGTHVVDSELYPANAETRFAEGVEVEQIFQTATGMLSVIFRQNAKATKHRHVNSSEERLTFPPQSEEFHQVVVALGQLRDVDEEGSWAHVLEGLLAAARKAGNHLIRDRNARVVGLQSADRRLRVLGASALTHPDVAAEWRSPGSASYLFFQSLGEQAKVDVGITLAAVTIAEANGVWETTRPNNNRNTACGADLRTIWARLEYAVDSWHDMRAVRIHPVTNAELQLVLESTGDGY